MNVYAGAYTMNSCYISITNTNVDLNCTSAQSVGGIAAISINNVAVTGNNLIIKIKVQNSTHIQAGYLVG